MGKVFLTGYPGFLAKRLVARLAREDSEAHFVLLVQPQMKSLAEATRVWLEERVEGLTDRCSFEEGDITEPKLGMKPEVYDRCVAEVSHLWHLAAIYDLTVPAALAYRINVLGTANVLDFCEACTNFERLDYVSTCFVSGTRRGLILESELDERQGFKNHYESTKCWAEMEVRRRKDRIPTVIHRPGIVVGDSRTGATDKYDGPYYLMRMLMGLPKAVPMVNIGCGQARVNIVPVDFVVDAMASIGMNPQALGMTVHLADSNPRSSREIVERILVELGHGKPVASVPPGLITGALDIGFVRRMVGIPKESVVYFNHEVTYDTMNQRKLLKEKGIGCPDFLSYLPVLLDYMRSHPEKG